MCSTQLHLVRHNIATYSAICSVAALNYIWSYTTLQHTLQFVLWQHSITSGQTQHCNILCNMFCCSTQLHLVRHNIATYSAICYVAALNYIWSDTTLQHILQYVLLQHSITSRQIQHCNIFCNMFCCLYEK